ncbi:cytidyltransferase-related enzyme [Schinkia azotoformans MEV2011]|uniref:Riboflavin biosynthesis protein n=1 Tax=Schinkia azotoformans MEV2011 TaxID=1348973 RepID=A0A072NII7_SCHAZ|nr:FAD synthetase family protein [Schinkia azotoformans]KEF37514.1 cytidyltransferase-related enzyme [Schinkia azotoformans MEV2011]MEC1697837.1 FAD synthetase family protein [Schinkia azotoformans]MEC1715992.1 FAD synthetase family protein [Schinkia azotoformans]MEC1726251.1 FAD synthetase family protein [Schinkia azotoformans]MEC1744625.1 FAD synthetase family protein [Schinkia azotoformans]
METIYLEHSNTGLPFIESQPCVFALGFFDGVHFGHQRLIQTAKRISEEKGVPLAVVTFYPHPRQVFDKNNAPAKYLTPLHRKQEVLRNMGVDKLFIVKFDPNFAKLSPEGFVEQYLIYYGCIHVVAGYDYTYGYKGYGNMETLKRSGEGRFGVTVIDKISYNKEKIGSTQIRQLVSEGEVEIIPKHLGSYYKVNGYIARSHLLKNDMQELVIKVDADYLVPQDGHYQIQLNVHNILYHGTIQKISIRDNYTLLYAYIYEEFNLSIGSPVDIKWLKSIYGTDNETNAVESVV